MSTHPTLIQMLVEAHANDLTDQAHQARLARAARTAERPPSRLRAWSARLLVGLARRLDDRLAPIPAPASLSGSRRVG
ncbi:MAG: hypothetical protein JWO98_743 [Frankiales bacterium]|nr:hypothetical protein [Frankiales bacterium]